MVDSTNLPDVDINQIATDLNGKMDRDGVNAIASVCIESWHDENGNWYRVYSDGWCEQGGQVSVSVGTTDTAWSVTFQKSFLDINYTVQTSVYGGWSASNIANIESKTSTQMSGFAKSSTASVKAIQWVAYGYIR